MMTITEKEFRAHTKRYLRLAESEDVFVSEGGEETWRVTGVRRERVAAMRSLFGCIPADITLEEAMEERADGI